MGDEAQVTPNGTWQEAVDATVVTNEQSYNNIPILRMEWTTANLTVRKERYVHGLVVLNELEPPEHENPITLPLRISYGDPVGNLEIDEGGDWPVGVAVLFVK